LRIDVRFGGADTDRAAAMQLIGVAPDLIVGNGALGTTAVQQQTRTIPIVFLAVGEPCGKWIREKRRIPFDCFSKLTFVLPGVKTIKPPYISLRPNQ
jgi:hypothetical protein